MSISSSICHPPGPGKCCKCAALLIIEAYRQLGALALGAK